MVEQSWVHTGLGSLTELACTVYAQPPAQVKDGHTHTFIQLSSHIRWRETDVSIQEGDREEEEE